MTRPVALTIAGSDSGGGAGIQADLRAFSSLSCFGTTVITALTAQNLQGVEDVFGLPVSSVRAQIRTVLKGFPIRAAKTGMLWSAENVECVASFREEIPRWIVDPVMVSATGHRLLTEEAIEVYRKHLLPGATLITPNLDEAAVLLRTTRIERSDMESAARELAGQFRCAVLLKGGHLTGDPLDVLFLNGELHRFVHTRIENINTHGTGCILSAAVTAYLTRGLTLLEACVQALSFVRRALERSCEPLAGERLCGIEEAAFA